MPDTPPPPHPEAGPARHVRGEDSDRALGDIFRAIGTGDHTALERLYDLSARDLYGLALCRTGSPEDAADVVQEVFVRVARNTQSLASVRAPRAWLLTVTHRLAVDAWRRRARRREDPPDTLDLLHAAPEDPGRVVDAVRVSTFLLDLPPAQREAVYLRHYQDLSFAAIGDLTGVPTFTAASRYRLGIAKLRRRLEIEP